MSKAKGGITMKNPYHNKNLHRKVKLDLQCVNLSMGALIVTVVLFTTAVVLTWRSRYIQYHELDAVRIPFREQLFQEHPVSVIVSIISLLLFLFFESNVHTWRILHHFRPYFGSKGLSIPLLDEQADCKASQWEESLHIYATPELLIGTEYGMTAIRYYDIQEIYIKTARYPDLVGYGKSSHFELCTRYTLIVRNYQGEAFVLYRGDFNPEKWVRPIIEQHCDPDVWKTLYTMRYCKSE